MKLRAQSPAAARWTSWDSDAVLTLTPSKIAAVTADLCLIITVNHTLL